MEYLGANERELIISIHEMLTNLKVQIADMKERQIEMNRKISGLSSRKGKVTLNDTEN